MILFFDSETSGKADNKADHTADHQPHLVQLAAKLVTEDERTIESFTFIVKPDGWTIPDEAAAIHGMTTEFCLKHGRPLPVVLNAFKMLCRRSEALVAYNFDFDYLVMRAAFHRAQKRHIMDSLQHRCAMKPMTNICQIPNEWGSWKWPKLIEAHQFLFGEGFDGAHDAMVDVDAMIRVFFEVRRRKEAGTLV